MRVYDGHPYHWTAAREARLRELWPQRSISLSEICAQLDHMSDEAITQKARRLGLGPRHKGQGRWASSLEPKLPRRRTPNRMSKALKAKVEQRALPTGEKLTNNTAADFAIPVAQRKSLLELTETSCRWPVGEPSAAEFFFCAAPTIACGPYCQGHTSRAFKSAVPP